MFELEPSPAAPAARVLSVSELNRLVRVAIEGNVPLSWVAGEISNLKRYDSGHCYFTLKDDTAEVSCVISSFERVRPSTRSAACCGPRAGAVRQPASRRPPRGA